MAPRYSIVTTCKGRLRDLQVTLPGFLQQENTEVIVVDYDCPDSTASYVARSYPAARVVPVTNEPGFNLSRARNLGAAQAVGEFLVFLDADVVIAPNFVAAVDRVIQRDTFGVFVPPAPNSLRGSCVVGRRAFESIGGYDELLSGYESEDLDLYMRLKLGGARQVQLDATTVVDTIEQTPEEKGRFRGDDLRMQFLRGQLYSSAKEMVMCVLGTPVLDLPLRRRLLDEVNRRLPALYAGEKDFRLEVHLPDKYRRGFLRDWEFSRSVVVKARRKKTPTRAP